MSLMWMKEKAPWVIGVFGVLIVVGLIMMDQGGGYSENRQHNMVGKVNGEEIPTDQFQMELKNYLKSQEDRTGKAPEGLQLALAREGFFSYKVQDILLQKIFRDYQLFASVAEMQDYLLKHPKEVAGYILQYRNIEGIPSFLSDSTFNPVAYEAWLSQDSIYDRISMQDLENRLKTAVIPQGQVTQILKSQIHETLLERVAELSVHENKAKLLYYSVSADSFPSAPEKFQEPELKAYFKANPDSFYFRQDAVRLNYVKLSLAPSPEDSLLMFNFAKELKERAQTGEKFEDLAKDYSNDAATAEKGGKLEGLRVRESLEKTLAEAAWKLNPGEISAPLLGASGYHVLLLHARKIEDGVEKADLSQILLKVTAGTETLDALMETAEKVRAAAQKDGLEKAALAYHLTVEKTPVFEKDNMAPLGGQNYVQGLNSFAFSQFEAKEKISEAIQTDDGVYLLERDVKYPKGRNFERAKERIAEILARQEKLGLAKQELESHKTAIEGSGNAPPARIGKAVLDSSASGPTPGDAFLPGFGYASPALYKVFAQPVGVWGSVLNSDQGAVLAKVLEKVSPSDAELKQMAASRPLRNPSNAETLFQDWLNQLQKGSKVDNKMDMVFRN